MADNSDEAAFNAEHRDLIVLGCKEDATDIFVLGLAIVSATNLHKAIPKSALLSGDGEYALEAEFAGGGHRLATAPFAALSQPQFGESSAIVRLLSTPEQLARYLGDERFGNVVFTLASTSSGVTLATAAVNVGQRLGIDSRSIMAQRSMSYDSSVVMRAFDPARADDDDDPVKPDKHAAQFASDPYVRFVLYLRHKSAYIQPSTPDTTMIEEVVTESTDSSIDMHEDQEADRNLEEDISQPVAEAEAARQREKEREADHNNLEKVTSKANDCDRERDDGEDEEMISEANSCNEQRKDGEDEEMNGAAGIIESAITRCFESTVGQSKQPFEELPNLLRQLRISSQDKIERLTAKIRELEMENRRLTSEAATDRDNESVERESLKVELEKIKEELLRVSAEHLNCPVFETELTKTKSELASVRAELVAARNSLQEKVEAGNEDTLMWKYNALAKKYEALTNENARVVAKNELLAKEKTVLAEENEALKAKLASLAAHDRPVLPSTLPTGDEAETNMQSEDVDVVLDHVDDPEEAGLSMLADTDADHADSDENPTEENSVLDDVAQPPPKRRKLTIGSDSHEHDDVDSAAADGADAGGAEPVQREQEGASSSAKDKLSVRADAPLPQPLIRPELDKSANSAVEDNSPSKAPARAMATRRGRKSEEASTNSVEDNSLSKAPARAMKTRRGRQSEEKASASANRSNAAGTDQHKRAAKRPKNTPTEASASRITRVTRSNLQRHVRNKKTHECPRCEKKFGRLSTLKTHIEGIHGQYTNRCQVCSKGFSRPSRLLQHQMKKHPDVGGKE